MRVKPLFLVIGVLTSAGCASVPAEAKPPFGATARIGDTARIGGIAITPLALIEDSRCPKDAVCVWAGRVLLRARIASRNRSETAEMELGKAVAAPGGRGVMLTAVHPERSAGAAIAAGDYRFTFAAAEPPSQER